MKKEERLVKNFEKAKKEINDEWDYLNKHSTKYKLNKRITFITRVIAIALCLIVIMVILLFILLQKQDIINYYSTVENIHPLQVINITKNNVVHLEPDYVEDCIKLRDISSNVWQMRCKIK